jgi:uncharacterized protein (TIGR02145 family)
MKALKKIVLIFCIGLLAFVNVSNNAVAQTKKDEEKTVFKTVKIGTQVWMVLNLNVSKFRNGDLISEAKTEEQWKQAGTAKNPAWCYYENNPENEKYGKLYNWYAATDPRGIAPEGWHVPTNANWSTLVKYLGRVDIAGKRLKDTIDWKSNGKGDNRSGFSGLPGGVRLLQGKFSDIGAKGQWWSTSGEVGAGPQVYSLMLISSSVEARFIKLEKENGLSIRCIKD